MSDLPAGITAPAPDRTQLLGEAYRRGILPQQQRQLYEEAVRRGLIKPQGGSQAVPSMPGPAAPAGKVPAAADPLGPMGSAFTRSGTALRQGQESFTSRMKAADEERRLAEGYEPGVDYDTGTGFIDAIQMKRMRNPAEKRAFLVGKYGEPNVFQDRRGEFYVQTPEGKRLSPEGSGFIKGMLSDLYANAPEIAGGTLGAAIGSAAGPAGTIAGAMLGGAAGRAADEAIKSLMGQQRQTLGQEVGGLAGAGAEMGTAEMGGRLVTALPGMLGRAFRGNVTGTTPEARSLAGSVEAAGGTAPLRSVTPGLSSAIQKQDISTRLGADWLEERNRAAVHGRLLDILENAGMAPAERQAALGEILDPTARVSARAAGEPIVSQVRADVAGMESDIARESAAADQQLATQLSRLNALSRRAPPGMLGEDVAGGIAQARRDFSTAMQKVYSRVDQMIGGQPVVPTATIKRQAKTILDQLPKDPQGNPIFGDPRVLRSLQQLMHLGEEATPNPRLSRITLGDAQRIRSTLGELGEFTDLTPGIAKRKFDQLRQSVDAAIGQAGADPNAQPAIRLLRQADQSYSAGIKRFEDATINRIASQARTGVLPDPGKVADTILQPRFTARAREIKQMVGNRVWRRVAAADWENIVAAARDPQTGEISARKMSTLIAARDRNGMLDLTYEPAIARDIRLYSKRLDVRGGKMPAATLSPDNFAQTMTRLEAADARRDAFMEANYLSALAKPGPRADDAVAFVLKPGEETRLMEAQNYFGDASPQMTGIRQQALKELLNSAIVTTQTGAGTTVEGEGIEKALSRFTPRQQEILFPGGLAEDMRRLAKEVRFMFPAKTDQLGGALISGMVKNIPLPARLIPLVYYEGTSWIFSQPSVVRALANGLRPGPGQAATRESIRMIFRAAAAGTLPDQSPEPAPDVVSAPQAVGRKMIEYQLPTPSYPAQPAPPLPPRPHDQPLRRGMQ